MRPQLEDDRKLQVSTARTITLEPKRPAIRPWVKSELNPRLSMN
jgi:hypothetical protein